MILSNNISVATGGQIIVRNDIKYSGGRYGLICLCSGVDRLGKPTVYYEACRDRTRLTSPSISGSVTKKNQKTTDYIHSAILRQNNAPIAV